MTWRLSPSPKPHERPVRRGPEAALWQLPMPKTDGKVTFEQFAHNPAETSHWTESAVQTAQTHLANKACLEAIPATLNEAGQPAQTRTAHPALMGGSWDSLCSWLLNAVCRHNRSSLPQITEPSKHGTSQNRSPLRLHNQRERLHPELCLLPAAPAPGRAQEPLHYPKRVSYKLYSRHFASELLTPERLEGKCKSEK